MKNMKTINLYSEEYLTDLKVDEFMEFWQAKINQIPHEFRDAATISIESDSESSAIDVCISYDRIETDEEEQSRKLRVKKNFVSAEAKEMSQYLFLKNKLGL